MNFNKYSFTVEEFLALPVYEEARLAPVETPFLLKGGMSFQQNYIQHLLVDPGKAGVIKYLQEQKKLGKNDYLKVQFWRKYKDHYVQNCGGNVRFDSDEKIAIKHDKIVFNLGDDIKFDHVKYDDGRVVDEPNINGPIGG